MNTLSNKTGMNHTFVPHQQTNFPLLDLVRRLHRPRRVRLVQVGAEVL